jgi:hypothetical protein
LLSVAAIGAFASSADAAVTMYSSQAAFDAAVPTASTFGFNAGGVFSLEPNPVKMHGLSFRDDATAADAATGGVPLLFLVDTGDTPTYGVDFLTYQNTQPGIIANVLSKGATAIGFTFGSYLPTGDATLTLSTGDSFTISPSSTATFIGFTSTTPITSVSVDYPNSYAFDLTSVSVLGSVPEPASWALMLIGIGGLGAAMRNRRRSPAAA